MDYESLIINFNAARDMPIAHHVSLFSSTHVFDEDKSVKWNREEVERQNKLLKENNLKSRMDRYQAINKATDNIIDYLTLLTRNNYSRDVIKKLFEYVYEKEYSDNHDIQQVVDICEELILIFLGDDS